MHLSWHWRTLHCAEALIWHDSLISLTLVTQNDVKLLHLMFTEVACSVVDQFTGHLLHQFTPMYLRAGWPCWVSNDLWTLAKKTHNSLVCVASSWISNIEFVMRTNLIELKAHPMGPRHFLCCVTFLNKGDWVRRSERHENLLLLGGKCDWRGCVIPAWALPQRQASGQASSLKTGAKVNWTAVVAFLTQRRYPLNRPFKWNDTLMVARVYDIMEFSYDAGWSALVTEADKDLNIKCNA
jgi:hypothetical protein